MYQANKQYRVHSKKKQKATFQACVQSGRFSNMVTKIRTPQRHIHDLAYSPYHGDRIACATGQFYGLAGSGSLIVVTLGRAPEPIVQSYPWSDSLFSLAWSEKNYNVIVTGGGDGALQVYDVMNTKGPAKVVKAHSREVSCVQWCQARINSHLFISSSWDQSIKLWNGELMQMVTDLPNAHCSLIYEVQSSPLSPGVFSSCSGDGNIRVWDMNSSKQPVLEWKAHDAEILSTDWCKYDQNILATAGTDGLVKLWDIRSSAQPICVLVGHGYAVRRVRFSPHHPTVLLSASYDFSVKLWNYMKHNHAVESFNHHSEFVCGLDFSLHNNMQVASGSWDESVAVWDLPT